MPCFKGLAVSIHTSDGPLSEFSIQKQSRQSRITSYIPVPAPKIDPETGRHEPCSFSVSITLLTPGQAVPYSTPKATSDNPYPAAKIVGGLPGLTQERGRYVGSVGPYIPLTSSPNETVAAYIHFDGRAKEEVATLLRRSEETWVNSRWVSVPESEGGGLAERDFLFREVGLERWLSGMDINGSEKEIAARVARRKERLEKKRRKRLEAMKRGSDEDEFDPANPSASKSAGKTRDEGGVLRYGGDKDTPVENLHDDDDMNSDTDSEDDESIPEAAGQIKVALYRVLASGEVKKGEYSPQFDAHDDDDMGGDGGDADVDHTTTFAKPKTLDPKSISTQTVTGIDAPDAPYATFIFFYRGQKQLQKMGILPSSSSNAANNGASKRKPGKVDFGKLGPLKATGTAGFTGYRDSRTKPKNSNGIKKSSDNDAMSDEDEDDSADESSKRKLPNSNNDDDDDGLEAAADEKDLTPEELQRRKDLAEGVKKMQLKRQHSAEPPTRATLEASNSTTTPPGTSSGMFPAETGFAPAAMKPSNSAPAAPNPHLSAVAAANASEVVGSPLKKQRPSVAEGDTDKSGSSTPASAAFATAESHKALSEITADAAPEVKDEEM